MIYKKIILLHLITMSILYAQNEIDALRYSLFSNYNTAGISALGGAGGFLSHNYNPASLAFFQGNQLISISPGNTNKSIESNYLSNQYTAEKSVPFLQNAGYVAQLPKLNNSSEWSPVNIAFSINRKQDFNREYIINGYNDESSMIGQFIDNSQGTLPENLNTPEWLAWWTFLTDPINDIVGSDTTFTGAYSSTAIIGQNQNQTISEHGFINEFDIAFSRSYKNKLFLGASIGLTEIYFSQKSIYTENGFDKDSGIENFEYTQERIQEGGGVNLKLGAIVKPISFLRIGWAYHSKTHTELSDYFRRSMTTTSNAVGVRSEFWIDEYDFTLSTPSKSISSIALIGNFNKIRMLATFDFEIVQYNSAQLASTHSLENMYYYDFNQENNNISNYYEKTNNKKLGLFLSLSDISIRGGYAIMGSPFQSDELNNWNQEYLSAGIGYKINNYSFDIAMIKCLKNEDKIIYYTTSSDQFATLNQTENTIIATCSYKF